MRRSLKTQSLSVGKLRLSDLEKQERQMAEHASSLSEGKMTYAEAPQMHRPRLHGDSSLKPRTKAQREERLGAIHATHLARRRRVNEAAKRKYAEGELVKAHDLLAATVASIGDAVILTDENGNVTFLNPEAERLSGWKDSEAKGQTLPKVFHILNEQTRQTAENPVEKVLRTGKVAGMANHTLLVSKDGVETPIGDSTAPIRHADGPLFGAVLVFRDVTAQRRAQEAASRLAAIIEHSGDAIITKNLNGVIQTWNPSAERLFGYRAEEIVGKPVTVLFPPDRLKEEDYIIGLLRQGQPVERLETIRVAKDGKQIPVSVSVSPMKDADGQVIGAAKIIHDISDVVAAREALLREKQLLATTLSSIGDAVIVTDTNGGVTFLNAEAERLTKWSNREAAGQPLRTVFRIVNEETRALVENPVEKVLRLGDIVRLANHTVLIAKDGTEMPIGDSAAPIREPDGPVFGVVLVFRDVTEQHKTQQAIARLAAIVEHSGDAMVTKNLDGVIQSWNSSAERLFGYDAEEIVGKHVTLLFPPDRLNEEDHIINRLRQGQPIERLETIRLAKDGRKIPVAVSISPLKNADGEIVGASKILHDISEVVAAREALEREKELLATTLASIGDAVIVTDEEGRITYVNAEAERLTKWSSGDAHGQALPKVFCIVNEETRAPVENPVEKVLRLGGVAGLADHTILIAKDGAETPIDDSAAPIRRPGGPLFGAVLVFRDFTERKKAEEILRDAQQKLSQHAAELEETVAERTAKLKETVNDLESFSYSIAHDMRAPLRAMGMFARLLKDKVPAISTSPEARVYCEKIVIGAARLDNLINDALNFTKAALKESPLQQVDLLKLVHGLLDTYPNLQSGTADIQIEENLPIVLGNESLLTQCFSNLLGNAVKFVAPGVHPKVRVRSEIKDGFARIWVEDKGIGIPKHAQSRVFAMFQKLDDRYEGTGIGLAIVRKVVERMGGIVGVESEPDQGSRFWVDLRVAPKNENA